MRTDWIGETAVSDVGWDHLETLVDLENRMAGTEGERRGAELTRDALDRYAGDARLEEFSIQGWERGASSVEFPDSTQECLALPRSPSGEVAGELVDVGHGLPEEFERDLSGAVVLARSDVPDYVDRYVHRREKYYRAVEAGAAAFVYANHVPGDLPPTGSVGTDGEPIGPVPAVGVSAETGARLARRFAGEDCRVRVEADTPAATSQNVHATMGPDSERRVLVTAHVDAHDVAEGALDNGAGTATVLEVARALSAREADLDRRVEFVVFGAEEVGLVGSSRLAAERDPDSIAAVLNVDGVLRARGLQFYTHRFDALGAAVRRVTDRLGHPATVVPRTNPHSDHWPFVRRGVPGYHVRATGEDRGRGWGHTEADTVDKLDRRDLREAAIVLTELAVELTRTDLVHTDPGRLAAALEEEDLAEGMRYTGDWPF
jgi:Zn-dependent M28 family amino/carboxypeptidase